MSYHDKLDYKTAVEKCPEGYEVVTADDHTLQIDYDQTILPDDFQDKLNLLRQRTGIQNLRWWKLPSKSGNLHVTIKLPIAMSAQERIAWQAALGSDPKREMLGLIRVAMGNESPILFFEKQGYVAEVHTVEEEGRMFRSED